jgi:hypothetical protein
MKKILLATAMLLGLAACEKDADVASRNISYAADQFEINRRIVFFNGITDTYLMTIEGYCALGNADGPRELTVTCKTGPGMFKKYFLGLSDNVSYFADQLEPAPTGVYRTKVIFKPLSILPDIEVK